ncbi:hypothetical protein [Azotobacter chroococcum]|uniref:Uncharacterized protein n=1 Tax=Azotobacter chroococcum TaxID=353 RepID=A0AAP9YAE1_9GAMM|nr:hypothetical protein [Azotobacter chroococcum]QQE87168.1 hypothetical protein GKQ51_12635 [Azotobacter chroococcum]
MTLVSTAWHVISALLVFLAGMLLVTWAGRHFGTGSRRSLALYAWHTLFCLVYCWYVLKYGGDAIGYYRTARGGARAFDVGTYGVVYLTRLLIEGLGVSLLGTFLVYNLFGSLGLLAFDASLRVVTRDKSRTLRRLATLIVFLPSVSFWSSGIGKDALSFLATGLALWAALDLQRRIPLIAVAVAIMLLVRPHMAGMLVMGVSLALLLHPGTSLARRVLLGSVALAVAAALVPFGLEYAGVKSPDAESLMSYVEGRQGQNMQGGGAVDISSMSLPMKLFTYLFRPLPFEAHSIFALAAAVDNMILLYLFVMGGRAMLRHPGRRYQENRLFLWSYALIAWLMLGMTTANLGISLRQKWMFTPMLILLFLSALGTPRPQLLRPAGPPLTPVMQIYQRYGIRPGQQRREP